MPVRPREALGEIEADSLAVDERADIDATSRGLFEHTNRLAKADARRRSDRGVLLTDEFERLCRPRHQLAIEADPIGVEALPELVSIEGAPNRREQLPLERAI